MFFKKNKEIKVDANLKHIAFIMDGNGRWAKRRGMPRSYGHRQGAKTFENIVRECIKSGIHTITVYAFSTENWRRSDEEVEAIMKLLSGYIERAEREDNDIKFIFLGSKDRIKPELSQRMSELENLTKDKSNVLNIAFNYGGRAEIANAFNELIKEGKTEICEDDISSHLYTSNSPDPDFIVRTAGECRISNFLLWQSAYSEFYFTDVLWPDFDEKELHKAIDEFYKRKRNFGGVK